VDFFVSYSSADRPWAEWIAWQLEADGYQVVMKALDYFYEWYWARAMRDAISRGLRVVAVLSSDWDTAHGEGRWRVFDTEDPTGERGLLLPVQVREVVPPGLLKTRIYVDLVGRDAASARQALLAAARGVRGKPPDEPELPSFRGRPEVNGY
jgi:hypothetical protein